MSTPPRSGTREPSGALAGKRIAITRALEQAGSLRAEIEARGAYVISCPTICLAEPETWTDVDRALASLAKYDWIVFTSPNGVRFTLARARSLGISALAPAVAAAGPRTASTLAEHGVRAGFIAEGEGSIPLAEALSPVRGARILMARSDRSDPVAAGILRRRGAGNVDEIVAYRTIPTNPGEAALAELREGVDGIAFTSPSTLEGFLGGGAEWRRLAEGAVLATLGPTTTSAARAAGLAVHEAGGKTMTALVDALAEGLRHRAAASAGARARRDVR